MPIRYRKDFEAEKLNKCPTELHNKLRNPRCRMETYEKEPFNPIPVRPTPQPQPRPQPQPKPQPQPIPPIPNVPFDTGVSPLIGAGAGLVGAGGTLLGRRQLGRALSTSNAESEGYRRAPTSERGARVVPTEQTRGGSARQLQDPRARPPPKTTRFPVNFEEGEGELGPSEPTPETEPTPQPDPRATEEFGEPTEEPRLPQRPTTRQLPRLTPKAQAPKTRFPVNLEGNPEEVQARTINQSAMERARASRAPIQQAEGTEMTERGARPSPLEDPVPSAEPVAEPVADTGAGVFEGGANRATPPQAVEQPPAQAVEQPMIGEEDMPEAMEGTTEEGYFAGEEGSLLAEATERQGLATALEAEGATADSAMTFAELGAGAEAGEAGAVVAETGELGALGATTAEAGAEVAGSEGFVNPIADAVGAGLIVGGAVMGVLGLFGVGKKTPSFNGIKNAQALSKKQIGQLIDKVSSPSLKSNLQSIYAREDIGNARAVVSYKDAQGQTRLSIQLTDTELAQSILAYQRNPNVYKNYSATQLALMGLNPNMTGGVANAIKLPNGKYVPKTNDLMGTAYNPNAPIASNYYSKAIFGDKLKLNSQGQVMEEAGGTDLTQDDLQNASGATTLQVEQNQFIANANEMINKITDPVVQNSLRSRLENWKVSQGIGGAKPSRDITPLNVNQKALVDTVSHQLFGTPTTGATKHIVPATPNTPVTNTPPTSSGRRLTTPATTTPTTTTPAPSTTPASNVNVMTTLNTTLKAMTGI